MKIVKDSKKVRFTVEGMVRIAGASGASKPTTENRRHLVRADSEGDAVIRFSEGYAAAGGAIAETVRITERAT